MSYLRKSDDLMSKMAHNQAYIFEQSSFDGLPSYAFIKMYMCSPETAKLDKLISASDDEIYIPIKAKITKRGTILSSDIMHWIGYIYRSLSYLYNISSRVLFRKVPPKYLVSVYPLYHSQDPAKAASWIYESKLNNKQTSIDQILALMRKIY